MARALLTFILLLSLPFDGWAAAWTQKKGKGQLIVNQFFYRTKSEFTNDGDKIPLNDRFTGYTLNPYGEYGLTDDITIGFNAFLERAQFETDNAEFNGVNYGINDTEVFLRHRLWHGPTYALSAQGTIIVPGFHDDDKNPVIGPREWGAELRFLAGVNLPLVSKSDFLNVEVAYRARAGAPSDEWRGDIAYGMYLNENLMWLNEIAGTLRTNEVVTGTILAPTAQNANLLKGQTSFVHFWNDKENAVQLGFFRHLYGEDSGAGGGFLFSLWHNF